MSQNLPERSLRNFLSLRHPNHFVFGAQTIETSSLPTDSSRPLFEQIETFSSILTVYLNCKYCPLYTRQLLGCLHGISPLGEIPAGATSLKKMLLPLYVFFSGQLHLRTPFSAVPRAGPLTKASTVVHYFFCLHVFVYLFVLSGGGGMSLFVILAESAGPRHRSLIGTSLWYGWTLPLIALAGVAYLIRDWRKLCIASGIPAIVVAAFWL